MRGRPASARFYQHVPLAGSLSALENVFLRQRGWQRRPPGLERRFRELCAAVGYDLDPYAIVETLPMGDRQMVAILQALADGADLVIMDEPTASLSPGEREHVFTVVRRLAARGTSFVYVGHFLEEILTLTDAVTVLRDGRAALRVHSSEATEDRLVEAMVGREVVAVRHSGGARPHAASDALLFVRGLSSPAGVRAVDVAVGRGEVVGLAGLLGSGRSEILHGIFGSDPRAEGEILVEGRPVGAGPHGRIASGIALVPEDRVRQGLVPGFDIWRNVTLPSLSRFTQAGISNTARERVAASEVIDLLGIKARGPDDGVDELSGGNAQRVVIGKWLVAKPPSSCSTSRRLAST